MRKLKHGGDLLPGDFIAVSNGNYIDFGWYVGDGSGTLQYYHYGTPRSAYEHYEEFVNEPDSRKSVYWGKRFEKGFTKKCMWKSYINAVHDRRVIKLTNPEEIFTELEDLERYQQSKEVLIKLNFIKD